MKQIVMALLACTGPWLTAATVLGVRGTHFTLGEKPVFLVGISYYGALGARDEFVRRDLDDMQRVGFNWVRVWATWAAFQNNVSAMDAQGKPQEPFMTRLEGLVAECDRRGMVVDITLSRGREPDGLLPSAKALQRAVETLVRTLRSYRNWYLDMANERNIRDPRYVSFEDLKLLRERVKRLDPHRLVTASHGGDISPDDLRRYLFTARVDFITPHRPRNQRSPQQTAARTRKYLAEMKKLGRTVPVHYQEPFRRGFQPRRWEPPAAAFIEDLEQSIRGGAAGWCFHNGDQKDRPGGKPRRSFDMRVQRLFDQFNPVERTVLDGIRRVTAQLRER